MVDIPIRKSQEAKALKHQRMSMLKSVYFCIFKLIMSQMTFENKHRSMFYNKPVITREMIEEMKENIAERIDTIVNDENGIDFSKCSEIMDEIDDSLKRGFINRVERQQLMAHFFAKTNVIHGRLKFRRNPYDKFIEKMHGLGHVNKHNYRQTGVINILMDFAVEYEKWCKDEDIKDILKNRLIQYFETKDERYQRMTSLFHQALKNKHAELQDQTDEFMNDMFNLHALNEFITINKHRSNVQNVSVGVTNIVKQLKAALPTDVDSITETVGKDLIEKVIAKTIDTNKQAFNASYTSIVDDAICDIKHMLNHIIWKHGISDLPTFRFYVEFLKHLIWTNPCIDELGLVNNGGFTFNTVEEAEHVIELLELKMRLVNDWLYEEEENEELYMNDGKHHIYQIETYEGVLTTNDVSDDMIDTPVINIKKPSSKDWQLLTKDNVTKPNWDCLYDDIYDVRFHGINLALLDVINRYQELIKDSGYDKVPDWLIFDMTQNEKAFKRKYVV